MIVANHEKFAYAVLGSCSEIRVPREILYMAYVNTIDKDQPVQESCLVNIKCLPLPRGHSNNTSLSFSKKLTIFKLSFY